MKWTNFYTKVLHQGSIEVRFDPRIKAHFEGEVGPEGGVSQQKLDGTKSALRELRLNDDVPPKYTFR